MTSDAELCRRMPCVVCWRPNATDIVPDVSGLVGACRLFGKSSDLSVPTRGAKDADTVPLCQAHHQEWHSIGEAEFDQRHGLDLRAVGEAIREAMCDGSRKGCHRG